MEAGPRPSAALPPIGQLDPAALKREEAELQAAQTMVNINPQVAQPSPYSAPPPPYSYATSTGGSAPTSATTLKTSDSHRSSQTEYDIHPNSAPPKQSLPSIQEALSRRDDEQPSQPPRSPGPPYREFYRRHSSPSPARFGRSYAAEPAQDRTAAPRDAHYGPAWQSPPSPRAYGPVGSAPRPQSPRTTHDQWPASVSRVSQPPYQHAPPPPAQSPRGTPQYGPPSQSYVYTHHDTPVTTYGPSISQPHVTAHSAHPNPVYAGPYEPSWHGEDSRQNAHVKFDSRDSHIPLKRPHDSHDFDTLLNEVYECSHNLMQFSETFRVRSHQTQRSGPISGSTPSIGDVHEAKKFNAKIQEALDYVLQKVRTEEAERVAERAAREAMEKRQVRPERSDEPINGRKEISDGSLNNSDTKKRRGRAAPPGRCHSCNRAETPEWRRGPDGARTLCNACGLHYAKHARKYGAQKAAVAGSNLRPKSAGRHS